MRIVNLTRNTVLAEEAKMANTFFSRLVGLLNRSSLKEGEALVIDPSDCIHSLFMRFAIDVIFVDRQFCVIKAITPLKPWRITRPYFRAAFTVELPCGVIKSTLTQAGDTIAFK